jgi:pyruvate dehydrogenase E2 component (dihydrolipoamide acetyltransferase)
LATIKEVTVPDIGQFAGVEVIEVPVKKGSSVKPEDTLITLETEKASMDVPSPFAGTIHEMKIKLGDKVSQGDLIALIAVEEPANATAPTQKEKPIEKPSEVTAPESKAPIPSMAPASRNEKVTINVPDTGAATDVEVIEIAVKPGDIIKEEATLLTLESEKASMDIPSPHAGKVEQVLVKVGDKVSTGTPIVVMMATIQPKPVSAPSAPKEAPQAPAQKAPVQTTASKVEHSVDTTSSSAGMHAGPATRRLARELGVDLAQVKGSGRKGRIMTKDIQTFVKSVMQRAGQGQAGFGIEKAPEIDFSAFGEIEVKPLNRIKKWTAKNLYRNWVTIPHVTQFDEADITELEIFRQENNKTSEKNTVKLTPLPFIIKAVYSGLKAYPQFNASLSSNGQDLVFKKYFNIGVAVDTPNGLMVPVIKEVDQKGLFDLARELTELSALAKEGKLKNEQMQGSGFTISSLGSIAGTAFTPIINAPDVAILGVSKAQIKPIYMQDQFVPRRMLPLSLSYDHRVIDGVEAAKFTAHIAAQLQDIRKLLL